MVSTVTVSTIATVTSITSMAALGIGAGIAIFAVLLLIGLLATKELVGASDGSRQRLISRCLNISIIPLVVSFAVVVALKVFGILG
ncbi:MAG: hypothetical protein D4R38_00240 [Dehalococcoidia bacterium]|nr:MAG: hypothetical protein D4R38_00240 [Dehalococcoidia bacterium]